MNSSRAILAFLGLIFLVIVIISSSKIIETIRNKTGLLTKQSQNNTVQLSPSPTEGERQPNNQTETTPAASNEIPNTGPFPAAIALLGGGLLAGFKLKKTFGKL